jgi:hypothetical protein
MHMWPASKPVVSPLFCRWRKWAWTCDAEVWQCRHVGNQGWLWFIGGQWIGGTTPWNWWRRFQSLLSCHRLHIARHFKLRMHIQKLRTSTFHCNYNTSS